MNKLTKINSVDLTKSTEQAIENRYRIELRKRFQKDQKVIDILINNAKYLLTDDTFNAIRDLTKDCIQEETEKIFNIILQELLKELSEMHERKPSVYLVNVNDGKVLIPISAKDIYTPP